jgi:hypothetical protein
VRVSPAGDGESGNVAEEPETAATTEGGGIGKACGDGGHALTSQEEFREIHCREKKTEGTGAAPAADVIAARQKLANEFYAQQGYKEHQIPGHLNSIDFAKPIDVFKLPKVTVLDQAGAWWTTSTCLRRSVRLFRGMTWFQKLRH